MGGTKEAGLRVNGYVNARRKLLDYFGIKDDFYIKPSIGRIWEITTADMDAYVLKHGETTDSMQNAVIVKKGPEPMIIKKRSYTLVVALDCVKVCFIFENSKYCGKMPDFLG